MHKPWLTRMMTVIFSKVKDLDTNEDKGDDRRRQQLEPIL